MPPAEPAADLLVVPHLGEPLLTAADVAAYLGVNRATVYRLAAEPDGLPVIELAGRVRRFRAKDVRDFVQRRTRCPLPRRSRAARLLGERPR